MMMEVNIKKEKSSYSKLSTYESCPFKYKLQYIEKHYINEPTIATAFGTLVHHIEETIAIKLKNKESIDYSALINEFKNINTDFEEWKTEDPKEVIYGINFLKDKFKDTFFEKDKNDLTYEDKANIYIKEGIYRLESYLKNNPNLEVAGIEHEFNLVYKDKVIFHGFIDRIFYNRETNTFLVEDIKTYSSPLTQKDLTTPLQFVLYVLALQDLQKTNPVLIAPSDYKVECAYDLPLCGVKQSAGTSNFLERGIQKIDKLLNKIDLKEFAPNPNPLCHWCVFSKTYIEGQPDEAKGLCPYFCHWTKNKKDFSVEYEWMGEDNHKAILEAYKKQQGFIIPIIPLDPEINLERKNKDKDRTFFFR